MATNNPLIESHQRKDSDPKPPKGYNIDNFMLSVNNIESNQRKDPDPKPPKRYENLKNRDLNKEKQAQEICLRNKFAFHVLFITYSWLVFLVLLFGFVGRANWIYGRPLISDAVLITLVSGTSLSVIIGMVSIILRHLFAANDK